MQARLDHRDQFLWIDEDPSRASRVNGGAIEVAPVKKGIVSVPHGLIHDWVGAAFIPNTSLDEVLSTVRDYDHYKDFFQPEVTSSRLIEHSPDEDQFSMRVVNKVLFVSTGMDGDYKTQNVRVDALRFYTTSYTTKVREIQNYGQPDERELAPDQGDGYIWRLFSITRFEERDGGVYVEIEAMALTRDVPASVRLFVSPIIKKLSKNSLTLSLRKTREAVHTTTEATARTIVPEEQSRVKALGFQH